MINLLGANSKTNTNRIANRITVILLVICGILHVTINGFVPL